MYVTQANGGVARYLQMLFKYMDRSKYEQILIYPNEYINEKNNFIKLLDKIDFIDMSREINVFNDIKSIYQLSKMIEKYNPDLIYANSSKTGVLARLVNIKFNKPIIYNPHGWAFNMDASNKKRILYTWIERFFSKKCDRIIAISEEEKKSALQNRICPEEKIEVIVNGIDIEEYEDSIIDKIEYREKLKIPKDFIVIGMVGRISRQKAPDTFIKVAAKIKEKMPNTFFVIVGDGEQREPIKELIKEYKIEDSVLITGWVENAYQYIQIFDVAMLLSRWEGFGLAIAEYMVCKVPIIATNVDAIPNLITNNETGILVTIDNVDEIVNAFFEINRRKELSDYLIKNAYAKVRKEFDVKRVAEEHKDIIDEYLYKN